jgi:hypothetical protein
MNESSQESDPLIGQLRRLQPAKSNTDVRQVFYQAGFEACRAQMRSRNLRHFFVGVAAATIALLVLIPASYQAGKSIASRSGAPLAFEPTLSTSLTGDPGFDQESEHLESSQLTQQPPSPGHPLAKSESASQEVDSKQPAAFELAAVGRTKNQFASWMTPLADIARSAKLDRQSESMVTTSHASLFVLESSIRNLSEFPFAVATTSQFSSSLETESVDSDAGGTRQTLAVGDVHALTLGLEATR